MESELLSLERGADTTSEGGNDARCAVRDNRAGIDITGQQHRAARALVGFGAAR